MDSNGSHSQTHGKTHDGVTTDADADMGTLFASTMTQIKGWVSKCLQDEPISTMSKREDLRASARGCFVQVARAVSGQLSAGSDSNSGGRNGNAAAQRALHEDMLATTIKELAPAFAGPSSTHQTRICALNVFLGALEGCKTATLSNDLAKLLSAFLLNHSGPIQDDGSGDDLDEQIRDVAMQALTVLISIPCTIRMPKEADDPMVAASNSHGNAADNTSIINDLSTAVTIRIDAAQQGVKRRCALPADDFGDDDVRMEDDYGFGDHPDKADDFRSGLSHLPRSKRTLCFNLVQGAIDVSSHLLLALESRIHGPTNDATNHNTGNNDNDKNSDTGSGASSDNSRIVNDLQQQVSKFCSFAASCLHGESDPRCLLQLLKLLNSLQSSFATFLCKSQSSDGTFPSSDVFDAVAPYFPIQFTPPPNNPYGITREGLHDALMSVLHFTDFDDNSRSHSQHAMLDLSAGLFLEQLLPPTMEQDDEPPSVFEQLEALDALHELIFAARTQSGSDQCEHLLVNTCGLLAKACVNVHDDASLAVANSTSHIDENKLLAEKTRSFVSKLAFGLERCSGKNGGRSWAVFVDDAASSLSRAIKASPATCKTSIAYLACLQSCGGPGTLRACLAKGLAPLVAIATERRMSTENLVASCYGIGAFFSASRVAMQRAASEGIALHPHPMDKLSAPVFHALRQMLPFPTSKSVGDGSSGTGDGDVNGASLKYEYVASMTPIYVAAARTMESVLVSSPKEMFESAEIAAICDFLKSIADVVLTSEALQASSKQSSTDGENDSENDTAGSKEWLGACTATLGYTVGYSLDDAQGDKESSPAHTPTVLSCDEVRDFVESNILAKLLQSACERPFNQHVAKAQSSRKTLALACACNTHAAKTIMSRLLTMLKTTLQQAGSDDDATQECAHALSFALQKGGAMVCTAFHQCSSPSSVDVLELMTARPTAQGELIDSVDSLALPAPPEEQLKTQRSDMASINIARCMIPAYSNSISAKAMKLLVTKVSNVLPPLSPSDSLTLGMLLPLLAAALNADETSWDSQSSTTEANSATTATAQTTLLQMTDELVSFALSDDQTALGAKNAAVSCLHLILRKTPKAQPCPVIKICDDVILLAQRQDSQSLTTKNFGVQSSNQATFRLIGLLTSAAASRGGSSSPTADALVRFLVGIACTGKANTVGATATDSKSAILDVTDQDNQVEYMLEAASSFGSVMSLRSMSPFTKQRLSHAATKQIQKLATADTAAAGAASKAHNFGAVATTCHIVCCGSIDKMPPATVQNLAKQVLSGLFLDFDALRAFQPNAARKLRLLILAALTKMIALTTRQLPDRLTLVRGILRSYATTYPDEGVAAKVLALQALELIGKALADNRGDATELRPAVISLLGTALNHPSSVLRQAAVDVRNAWYFDE